MHLTHDPALYTGLINTGVLIIRQIKPVRAPRIRVLIQTEALEHPCASLPCGDSRHSLLARALVPHSDRPPEFSRPFAIRARRRKPNRVAAVRAHKVNGIIFVE